MKKLCLIGSGRFGKDQVAEILRDKYGVNFSSSSWAAYDIFIYDLFKDKYGYSSIEEAYNSRHNHRDELYDLITKYNTPDKTRLAREIMERNAMYVGMRCKKELTACVEHGVFDLVVWVDASERVSYREPDTSITVTADDADIILDNNGTLEELELEVDKLWRVLNE